jgi:hypothetical protein
MAASWRSEALRCKIDLLLVVERRRLTLIAEIDGYYMVHPKSLHAKRPQSRAGRNSEDPPNAKQPIISYVSCSVVEARRGRF